MTTRSSDARGERLARLSAESGQFAILALDHVSSFAATVRPSAPESLSPEEMYGLKERLVSELARNSTAVLIDPAFALNRRETEAPALPVGLILGIEDGDYDHAEISPRLLPGWTVDRASKFGADAVKISFYFDPDSDTSEAEAFVAETVRQCEISGLPLFCEPLVRLAGSDDTRRKVLDGVRRFGNMGVDVLKIQFPGDTDGSSSRDAWVDACGEVTEQGSSPWALLSEGRDYVVFRELLTVACQQGASGFLGGRAIWGGAVSEADAFAVYAERLSELRSIAVTEGTSWKAHLATSEPRPEVDSL
jgi:tagatose 1,6-diphosphate aldolase